MIHCEIHGKHIKPCDQFQRSVVRLLTVGGKEAAAIGDDIIGYCPYCGRCLLVTVGSRDFDEWFAKVNALYGSESLIPEEFYQAWNDREGPETVVAQLRDPDRKEANQ